MPAKGQSDPSKKAASSCPQCGVVFSYYRSALSPTYCSNACYLASNASKKTEKDCPTCGKTFAFYKSWPRVYCSNECAGKANVGNIKHFSPSRFTATCKQCGQAFEATAKRTYGLFCSSICWGQWQADHWDGENGPHWRGSTWKAAQRAVRQRDKACVECGITPEQLGRKLDVHHIVPFRVFGTDRHAEANALTNLVAMCSSCHNRIEPKK